MPMNHDFHCDIHDDEKDYMKRLSYKRNRSQAQIGRERIFRPTWRKEYLGLIKEQDAAGVTQADLNSFQMRHSRRKNR